MNRTFMYVQPHCSPEGTTTLININHIKSINEEWVNNDPERAYSIIEFINNDTLDVDDLYSDIMVTLNELIINVEH